MTIQATRSIDLGEEVTVAYFGVEGMTRLSRRIRLREKFAFDCACTQCSLSGDALIQSDVRQRRIAFLKHRLEEESADMGTLLEEAIVLLHEETMPSCWLQTWMFRAMSWANSITPRQTSNPGVLLCKPRPSWITCACC